MGRLEASLLEFENRHAQQQIDLTQSLERAYTLSASLREELDQHLRQSVAQEVARLRDKVEAEIASSNREQAKRQTEAESNAERQLQEVCGTIEELAKVVRALETKSLEPLYRGQEQTAFNLRELEKMVNGAVQRLSQAVDENHRGLLQEIGHLKKRHARLLSLYSAGLEQQMSKENEQLEALTIDELEQAPQPLHQTSTQPLHQTSTHGHSSSQQYPLQELIQINEGLKSRFEQLKELSRHS